MSNGAKSAESRILAALLLFTCFLLLAKRTPKRVPLPEPSPCEDDTQPVRPIRRSMEEREEAARRGLEDVRKLQRQYPPVTAEEE